MHRLEVAVEMRNYLAHHLLREYFVVAPSETNRGKVLEELAGVHAVAIVLDDDLQERLRELRGYSLDDLPESLRTEMDELRPTEWDGFGA